MLNLIIYLLEVSICMSIMYVFYRYLYFKLSYFEWSRYFFYGALILSLLIPFLPGIFSNEVIYEKLSAIKYSSFNLEGDSFFIEGDRNFTNDSSKSIQIPFLEILTIIWVSGLIRYFWVFIRKLMSVKKLIKRAETVESGNYIILKTDVESSAFSFFKYIFINEQFEKLSEEEKKQILDHEKLHSDQYHSLDNIIFDIFRAFFWFNPLSKRITSSLKEIHEFIVDTKLTGNVNKPDYSRLIIKLARSNTYYTGVSSFSKDKIKDRIKLISHPESHKIRRKRFIISIPVLLSVIFTFYMFTSIASAYAVQFDDEALPFIPPFEKGRYRVISPYFYKKRPGEVFKKSWSINTNSKYVISHPELTYEVKSFSKVLAVADGTISKIDTVDNWGVNEIKIEIDFEDNYKGIYKNLYKTNVKVGDFFKKGDKIALTGDVRLYPTVSFRLKKDNKHINPIYCY